MPWVVTLKVTDCATDETLKALVTNGDSFAVTDANGELIVIIDDVFKDYFVSISSEDYVNKTFDINRQQHEGTIQTVCLNKIEESGDGDDEGDEGGGGGGGGGGAPQPGW